MLQKLIWIVHLLERHAVTVQALARDRHLTSYSNSRGCNFMVSADRTVVGGVQHVAARTRRSDMR